MKNNFLELLFLSIFIMACGGSHQTGKPSKVFDVPKQNLTKLKNVHQFTSTFPDPTTFVEYEIREKALLISGKNLVIKNGESTFAEELSDADVERLVFHLDHLIIESPVVFHGKDIEIRVRKLEFRGAGVLDVSGVAADGLGENGGDSGNILLDAEEIIDQSSIHTKRFVLNGGRGGHANKGRTGKDGASVPVLNDNIVYKETLVEICIIGKPKSSDLKAMRRLECSWNIQRKEGQSRCPQNGEDAVSAKRPGRGGRAGKIKSKKVLDLKTVSLISEVEGESGEMGQKYKGGSAGLPRNAIFFYKKKYANGKIKKESVACLPTENGKDAPALEAVREVREFRSGELRFHSTLGRMKVVLNYVEELWAKGFRVEALKELSWVETGLERESLKSTEETTLLALLQTRTALLKLRVNAVDSDRTLDATYLEEKFFHYFDSDIRSLKLNEVMNDYMQLARDIQLQRDIDLASRLGREMREVQFEIADGDRVGFGQFMYARTALHQMQEDDLTQMDKVSLKSEDITKLDFYLLQNDIEYYFYQIAYTDSKAAVSWLYDRLRLDMLTSVRMKVVSSNFSRNFLIKFDGKLTEVVRQLQLAGEVPRLSLESVASELYQLP